MDGSGVDLLSFLYTFGGGLVSTLFLCSLFDINLPHLPHLLYFK